MPFAAGAPETLTVVLPDQLLPVDFPEEKAEALRGVLAQDPRPRYHDDPERIYGMDFAGFQVRFRVAEGVLTVVSLER